MRLLTDAFLFICTVSIAVALTLLSNFAEAPSTETRLFLLYLGFFAIKFFLDDLAHFRSLKAKETVGVFGFKMSLGMWGCMLLSILALIQIGSIRFGVFPIILTLSFATWWLVRNYVGVGNPDRMVTKRHRTWILFNLSHIAGLSLFLAVYDNEAAGDAASWIGCIFPVLTALVIIDMIKFTFPRYDALSSSK